MQAHDLDAPNLDILQEPCGKPRLFLEDDPPMGVEDDPPTSVECDAPISVYAIRANTKRLGRFCVFGFDSGRCRRRACLVVL